MLGFNFRKCIKSETEENMFDSVVTITKDSNTQEGNIEISTTSKDSSCIKAQNITQNLKEFDTSTILTLSDTERDIVNFGDLANKLQGHLNRKMPCEFTVNITPNSIGAVSLSRLNSHDSTQSSVSQESSVPEKLQNTQTKSTNWVQQNGEWIKSSQLN